MEEGGSRDGPSLSLSLSKEMPWRGPLGGSSFSGDPGRYVKKGSGCRHLSPWGAPFQSRRTWSQEGAHISGTLKEEWRAPLLGTPKDMSSNSEMGVCFYRGPAFGEHGGALLS